MSAWEDAKTYVSEAPPDGRYVLAILTWYVMLTILVPGPELSEDLRELNPKMKTSVEFMKYMCYLIARSQLNLAREALLQFYTDCAKEWSAFVQRDDELEARAHDSGAGALSEAEDDLAEWLEKIDMDDPNDENSISMREHVDAHKYGHGGTKAKAGMTSHELYRCSRYCDGGCQKSHWVEHKVECKGRT